MSKSQYWSSWEWHDQIYLCGDSGINCWSCLTKEQLGSAVCAGRMLWRVILHCFFLSCLMLSAIFCLCNFIVLFSRMADCKLTLFHLSTNAQAAAKFWKCSWFMTYLQKNTHTQYVCNTYTYAYTYVYLHLYWYLYLYYLVLILTVHFQVAQALIRILTTITWWMALSLMIWPWFGCSGCLSHVHIVISMYFNASISSPLYLTAFSFVSRLYMNNNNNNKYMLHARPTIHISSALKSCVKVFRLFLLQATGMTAHCYEHRSHHMCCDDNLQTADIHLDGKKM